MESGTHTAEPSVPKEEHEPSAIKQEEPVSTLYHYVPTESVILSPQVEVISPVQEIDDLRAYKKLSEERFDKLGSLIEQLMNERLAKK